MRRSTFFKTLFGLPFGGVLAKLFQSKNDKPEYLLNKFYVTGFQYYEGPSLIDEIKVGEQLILVVYPDNEYDKFAVEIYRNDIMLGHIPRTDNKHISRMLQQNVSLFCEVIEVNPDRKPWKMLKVEVWL
ncbi:HIRAN domain-containing protein [Fodinibius salsisoli]|uniref:HIRAN domain-containing protein n=1 Tax=Fodinibius salsisoli TaxID=2820877 RepID=A0ABT3PJ73_9BACT|nr:HIRAN domain-containing protein [Fodinibius salsisoli]MCW9705823.1 HIRAN domain-containing protein [Fodinibius salsisoli]